MIHIFYWGVGLALQDLIVGNVDMMFDGLGFSVGYIEGGRIKVLMVSGMQCNVAFLDVFCLIELGLLDYNVLIWYGVWVSWGMPVEVQVWVIEELACVCQILEVKMVWVYQGAEFFNLIGS